MAGVGGYFVPKFFGKIVPHTSYDTGWYFLAVVSFVFALVGLAGRNPRSALNATVTAPAVPAQHAG